MVIVLLPMLVVCISTLVVLPEILDLIRLLTLLIIPSICSNQIRQSQEMLWCCLRQIMNLSIVRYNLMINKFWELLQNMVLPIMQEIVGTKRLATEEAVPNGQM